MKLQKAWDLHVDGVEYLMNDISNMQPQNRNLIDKLL